MIDISWDAVTTETFHYYKVLRIIDGEREQVATVSPIYQQYRYTVPMTERGGTFTLGVVAYNVTTNAAYDVGTVRVDTHPNPATNLHAVFAFDSRVELAWEAPEGTHGVNGYIVERSSDGGSTYASLGVAGINRYIDIGNINRDPRGGHEYRYRLSTVTYAGLLSASITCTVPVVTRTIPDIRALVKKATSTIPRGKYRIKTRSDDGSETRWTVINNAIFPTHQAEYSYKYRVER
jgi:hypothetical protein